LDRADIALGNVTSLADQRQQPLWIGAVLATGRNREPHTIKMRIAIKTFPRFATLTTIPRLLATNRMHRRVGNFFRCRIGSHLPIEESSGDLFRRITLGQCLQEILIFLFNRLVEDIRIQNALIGLDLNRSNARSRNRLCIKLCHMQKALGSAAAREWHNQNTSALATSTARTA